MDNISWEKVTKDYWWFIPIIVAALILLEEVWRIWDFYMMLVPLAIICLCVGFVGWACSDSF